MTAQTVLSASDREGSYRLASHVAEALRESGMRIVVTGASGWLGTATLVLLRDALGLEFAARVRCFGSSARSLAIPGGPAVEQRPLVEICGLQPQPTIVLHLAFLTKDRAEEMAEEAFRAENARLSGLVLAALDGIGTRSVFVASSGAARFAHDPQAAHSMRLYGEMKLRDEEAFSRWAAEGPRTAVITRIFNVAGPFINKHQAYALAAFINDALAGRAITVRAPHRVERGFVAIRELMSLVFWLLVEARPGTVKFDTGGDAMELGEVADAVRAALGGGPVERAPITADHVDRYVGERVEYDRLRARYGIEDVPLDIQIRETAETMIAAPAAIG